MTPLKRTLLSYVPFLRRKRPFPVIISIVWAAALLAAIGSTALTRIAIRELVYTFNNGEEQQFTMPFKQGGAGEGDYVLRFIVELPAIHPNFFHIVPDDCLEALDINGEPVMDSQLPICDFTDGAVLDLSPYLRSGDNAVVARVRNSGGDAQLLLQTSWKDPVVLFPTILIPLLIGGYILFLLIRTRPAPGVTLLSIIFLCAAFLRTFYMLSTPYWVRGHDTDGHIEYIEYIRDHMQLPHPTEGWEFWQPPLYYIVGGVWAVLAQFMGLQRSEMLFGVQLLSLLLSCATLGVVVWIGMRLFKDSRVRAFALPIFFSVVAFTPGLVFLSSRINNDVLSVPLAFVAVALLLEWWNKGTRTLWALLMGVIALHLLTKNNGILLIPVAYLCLLLHKGLPWKRRLIDGLVGICIIAVVAGWFTVYRSVQNSSQDLIVGNTGTLNSGLLLTNDWQHYVVFNPFKVVDVPYNNPWDDEARRQYFWEYWYRSAFFGEFNFGEERKILASWLLLWGFALIALGLAGVVRSLAERLYQHMPFLLLVVLLSLGHAAFRFQYPYGSSQDFRYSLVLLVPFAFFVAQGIQLLSSPAYRSITRYAVQAYAAFCVAFLLHV